MSKMNFTNFSFLPSILPIKFLFSFSLKVKPHFSPSSAQIYLAIQVAHQITSMSIFKMYRFTNLCAQFTFSNFLFIKAENQVLFARYQLIIKDLFNFFQLSLYRSNALSKTDLFSFYLNRSQSSLFIAMSTCWDLVSNPNIYLSKIQVAFPFPEFFS